MGGKMEGKRFANMVFPDPGGPMRIILCPPAAAISIQRLIDSCPFTSEKSNSGNSMCLKNSAWVSTSVGSSCCAPLPGDDISGIITLGRGVAVHRSDCPNLLARQHKQAERLIAVTWERLTGRETFQAKLDLLVSDRIGLLQDILFEVKQLKINLLRISADSLDKDRESHIFLLLEVRNRKELQALKKVLTSFPEVYSVKRL